LHQMTQRYTQIKLENCTNKNKFNPCMNRAKHLNNYHPDIKETCF